MTIPANDDPLPDDPRTLQALVRELLEALAAERRERAALQARLDQLLRRLYGRKSEKVAETPQSDASSPSDNALSLTSPIEPEAPPTPKKGRHGRRRLPRELPRQRVEHDLSE